MSEKAPIPLEFDPQIILSKYDPDSKVKQYLDLLEAENKNINLVSRETSHSDLTRLAAESLLPFEVIKSRQFLNYLDIGSGGGFPAFPIIMSFNPRRSVLVERTKKKASALNRMSEQMGLPIEVCEQNFDECEFSGKFDLITLRLVRLTKPLFKKISELLTSKGVFIYYSKFEDDGDIKNLQGTAYSYASGRDSPIKTFTVFSRTSG